MSKIERQHAISDLIEAALDQPAPSPTLRDALNRVLMAIDHPLQLTTTAD